MNEYRLKEISLLIDKSELNSPNEMKPLLN